MWNHSTVANGGVSKGRYVAVSVSDRWKETHDMWHVTCDMWYVTCDLWHVKHDLLPAHACVSRTRDFMVLLLLFAHVKRLNLLTCANRSTNTIISSIQETPTISASVDSSTNTIKSRIFVSRTRHFLVLVLVFAHVKRLSLFIFANSVTNTKKCRIWETPTLSACADSSTNTMEFQVFLHVFCSFQPLLFSSSSLFVTFLAFMV